MGGSAGGKGTVFWSSFLSRASSQSGAVPSNQLSLTCLRLLPPRALPCHQQDKFKAALSFTSLPTDAYSDPAVDLTANPWITPYSEGSFTLAAMLSSGLAGALAPRDERQAVRVLHRAAAAGSGEAQLALADRYLEGRGVPKNVAEGIRCVCRQACGRKGGGMWCLTAAAATAAAAAAARWVCFTVGVRVLAC